MISTQKKIVICDDHPLFLGGITSLLLKFGNNYSVNAFGNTSTCEVFLKANLVDVFICDLNINNKDGFSFLDDLKMELKNTKTIILTAYYEDFLIKKAKKLGIHAFLKKETTAEELIWVIESAMDLPFYTNGNGNKKQNEYSNIDQIVVSKYRISKQEKEIIRNIIDGKTSKEIADVLFISKTTVDTHRKNIFKKLEISNSTSLIKFANENNLFS
jgi:DNA-binding NarL/FixJ family response regulator